MNLAKIIARRKLSHRSYRTLTVFAAITIAALAACNHLQQTTPPAGNSVAQIQPSAPLSADDVSILFPAPKTAADFANLIGVRDITTSNPQDATKRDPVWSDSAFQQFINIVSSSNASVGTAQISLPTEARSIDVWFVAGIRIDAGAPGLSSDIHAQYGRLPEIRLIIQPVLKNSDGSPKALDIAGHLIFDFIDLSATQPSFTGQNDCFPRFQPDPASFKSVVADLTDLSTRLNNGQIASHAVSTVSLPLGVHPGLADPATANALRNELLSFLEKHISAQRLGSMAIAGLPAN